MDPGMLFILLLLLACPLLMVFMHRGGHGEHGGHGHGATAGSSHAASLDELRDRRAELDAEIARLEPDAETKTPAAL